LFFKFLKVLYRNLNTRIQYSIPHFEVSNESDIIVGFLEYKFHEKFDGLLGNNILVKLNAVVDFKNRFFETDKAKIPIYLNKNEEIYARHFYKDQSLEIFAHELSTESNPKISKKNFANKKDKLKLNNLLNSFKDLFYKDGDQYLSCTNMVKHRTVKKVDTRVYSKLYRYPEIHQEELEKQIKEMLQQVIIVPSGSSYNAPLWEVPKRSDNSG
jgi:hypothetical protein